jgi:hypothetical protein
MSERLYFLISLFLVLCMVSNVSAQWEEDIEWDNDDGLGDRLWDTAANWDLDRVPNLDDYYDVAIMDATYTDINNGPIIQDGIDAECGWFEMGYKRPADEVILTMTGGTLTAGGWIDVGGYNAGYFEFDMDGGEVTVIGAGEGTWEGIWLAFAGDAYGVMDVSGGDLDIFGGLWLGWNANSYGLFNMTGGTYTGHYVYIGTWEEHGGAGRLNLHGGSMHFKDFCMGPVAHMDVTEGVLTCETDLTVANGWLFNPSKDTPIEGSNDGVRRDAPGYTATLPMLAAMGLVTAYDVNSGDIITDDMNYPAEAGLRALLKIDYDGTNPGMTTVSAEVVDPNLAWNPIPFDKARGVQPSEFSTISWSAGTNAVKHDVYFGMDETAVANADTLSFEYKGRQTGTNYTPDSNTPYELGADYFWRIDEVNASDEVEWPGSVWNFRAADHIVVEDFDSYDNDGDLWDVWSDYFTNGTGAEVYLETADANFIIDGNSMMYEYDNGRSPYYYSESTRIFSPSMDWTVEGLKALVLWFHGEPGNDAERMYLRVTDGGSPRGEATIVYADSNDLIQEPEDAWHEWNIELSDANFSEVDLSDVNGITIGFGDRDNPQPGPEGYVYFEDIRLYSRRCRWDISLPHGDFDGDCTINSYDMEIMAQTWLMSDSEVEADPSGDLPWVWYKFDEGTGEIASNSGDGGSGLNGTFTYPSDPSWVSPGAPAIGSDDPNWALNFDGENDKVEVPALNLNSNTVTISAWIKRDGSQSDWAGIVFSRDANSTAGISIGEALDLKYHWNGDNWWWDSGFIVPDNEWVFTAIVVEPTQATMYMNDGTFSSATNMVEHDIEEFNGITCVGRDEESSSSRFFDGLIDDVRIYTRALDMGEVMGLSGLTGMQYLPLETVGNIIIKDPPGGPYDSGNPDIVNLRDYAVMADSWLETILWP